MYGAADLKAGATASLYNVCADPRLNHNPPVTHGVLAERAAALLTGFFGERRAAEVQVDVDGELPAQA